MISLFHNRDEHHNRGEKWIWIERNLKRRVSGRLTPAGGIGAGRRSSLGMPLCKIGI